MQSGVDEVYAEFCQTVATNRNLPVETVKGTEAACYNPAEALTLKLIDVIGNQQDALSALGAHLANPPLDVPEPNDPFTDPNEDPTNEENMTTNAHTHQIPNPATAPVETAAPVQADATQAAITSERNRATAIISNAAKLGISAEIASQLIGQGLSLEASCSKLIDMKAEMDAKAVPLLNAVSTEVKPVIDPNLSTAERAAAEFNASPELKSEFGSVESYAAFMEGSENGTVKILKK